MRIKQILNNNVATVLTDKGQECVVVGKGIVFGKKVGESINVTDAVKLYKYSGRGLLEKLGKLVEEIPFEHVKICNEIVDMAKKEIGQVDEKIFLTLIDHISFAIERHKKGMDFADPFWEFKRLYPNEYRVGKLALDIIEKRLSVRMPESEASFIAFHFLNANGTSMQTARDNIKLIEGILRIVKKHFDIESVENDAQYLRFITHLRFLAGRIIESSSKSKISEKDTDVLLKLLNGMSREIACADEIALYVLSKYDYIMSKDEKSYLILHIHSSLNAI